jgi:hypothetical protein
VREVQNSKNLSADEKGDLQDILLHAEEGTNGLTQEEKLQNVSETVFSIVTMMVSQRLDGGYGRLQGLYKVIMECKWQICILAGILATCLIFRPEVAELLKAVLK